MSSRSILRSVGFNIAIVCLVTFVGPGLWNGAQSLGAGGALTPYLVSAGNSIVFGLMGLGCCLAPVLIGRFSLKSVLIGGTLGWSIYTAALYQNNRYGTQWFVLVGAVLCGASAGMYWAAEGAILLSYPEPNKSGKYLALWLAAKNSGQVLAGAINLGINFDRSTAGKVDYRTLLTFLALQTLALPVAFLLTPPEKVQRSDRSPVVLQATKSVKAEFKLLWKTCSSQKIGVLLPSFFTSWWYWGYASTFLATYFSVRARALASLLSAITGIILTTILGFFLDRTSLSIKTRVRVGAGVSFTLFSATLVWALIVQHQFSTHSPGKLDWVSPGFHKAFWLNVFLNATGNLVQNTAYFIMSVLSSDLSEASRNAGLLRGFEAFGQATSFGVGASKFSLFYTVVINVVFWAVSILPALITIRKIGVVEGYGLPVEEASEGRESTVAASEDGEKKVEEEV